MNYYCSHDGFFSEAYNDFNFKLKPSQYRNLDNDRAAALMTLTGHFDWLRIINEKEELANLKRIAKLGFQASNHYCLPDNILDDKESYRSLTDPLRDYWMDFRLPEKAVTISFQDGRIKSMIIAVEYDCGDIAFFPFSRLSEEDFCLKMEEIGKHNLVREIREMKNLLEMKRFFIKFCKDVRLDFNQIAVDTMAGLCSWASNTFCLVLAYNEDRTKRELVVKYKKTSHLTDTSKQKEASEIIKSVCEAFIGLMASPVEEVQWDIDPDFDPTLKLSERKAGHIPKRRPSRIRAILPRRRHVGLTPPGGEGTGVKQCQHSRNGHWRTYRNGRRIWIDSYVAGDPKLGSTVNQPKTIEIVPRRGS